MKSAIWSETDISSTMRRWRRAMAFAVPPLVFAMVHRRAFADGPSAPESSMPNAMRRPAGMS
jgi:hypothetical protein